MKKIVIASDSFKGSLSSSEIADIAEDAIRRIYPACDVVKIPIADGGEGTIEALVSLTDGRIEQCRVHDPLMNVIEASYGILGDNQTAVIEMAAASGLPLLSEKQRNPMLATSYGTGELILDALHKGCTHFLIGIGGSATNDAGLGMLQALGYRFFDKDRNELKQGGQMMQWVDSIDQSQVDPLLHLADFLIACDVEIPFCGKGGAAQVFARQKGADDVMIASLDRGMFHLAEVIRREKQLDIINQPGAGAAGGLGGGLMAFLNARLKRGVKLILDAVGFDQRISGADLIITGEGRMDAQTCMGKAPMGVLCAAKKQQIPVVGICGAVEDTELLLEQGFLALFSVLPAPVSLQEAMNKNFTQKNIRRTVEQLMRLIQYYDQKPNV